MDGWMDRSIDRSTDSFPGLPLSLALSLSIHIILSLSLDISLSLSLNISLRSLFLSRLSLFYFTAPSLPLHPQHSPLSLPAPPDEF